MGIIRVTRGLPKYNIQIGKALDAVKHNPTAVLSVTDSFFEVLATGKFQYSMWVPINEIGQTWGYKPFFTAKRILDYWRTLNFDLTYICCSGGIHRSPMTAFCWLLSLGLTPKQAQAEFYGTFSENVQEVYERDIAKGYIPDDLPALYKVMNENPTWAYQGVLQSMNKYESIKYGGSKLLKL